MKLSGSAMGAAGAGGKKVVEEVRLAKKNDERKVLKGGRGDGGCRRKEVIEASEVGGVDWPA